MAVRTPQTEPVEARTSIAFPSERSLAEGWFLDRWFLDRWLIDAYVAATSPIRAFLRRSLGNAQRLPVVILFFHRIADTVPNDWTMSTATFDRLIQWLERHCELVGLPEAQRRLREGSSGQRIAVSLTFDDGYADNCLHAIPLLIRRQIPFTYFVSTSFIGTDQPFPHDASRGYPLAPNSIEQIRAMSDAGVDIGVHTRSHADLGAIPSLSRLHEEVALAREDVVSWTGRQPKYFAFPYGFPDNLNEQAIRILYQLGFDGFCSAYGCYNHPGDDPFHLQRFHADTSLSRTRNWLSLDPRWIGASRKFHYRLQGVSDEPEVLTSAALEFATTQGRETRIEVSSDSPS